jgi:hypothetical protein
MPAEIIAVADAVTAEIGSRAWSLPVAPERTYTIEYSVEELAALKTLVVPVGYARRTLSRTAVERTVQVEVGLMRHTANQRAANDALIGLVIEMAEYFDDLRKLATLPEARPVAVTLEPICDYDLLRRKGVFQSVLHLEIKRSDG